MDYVFGIWSVPEGEWGWKGILGFIYRTYTIIKEKKMAEIEKKWYVIRAISGKEKKVKELLELEIDRHKLNDYVEQVLIPTQKIYQIRNGKKISKEKNYFPGYVLINAALIGEVEHVIKSLNVIGFLRCN